MVQFIAPSVHKCSIVHALRGFRFVNALQEISAVILEDVLHRTRESRGLFIGTCFEPGSPASIVGANGSMEFVASLACVPSHTGPHGRDSTRKFILLTHTHQLLSHLSSCNPFHHLIICIQIRICNETDQAVVSCSMYEKLY